MQKIVSKYALAAHLALMAVAPLFLLPFAGASATSVVLLWLSAFGFAWMVMEPSRRRGEMPHDARARVERAVWLDPMFWFSLVLVAYAAIRAANGGIRLVYDAELMAWSIGKPTASLFPGCIEGYGFFPFAAVLAMAVIFQGTRHALGRSARGAFLLVSSVLSALSAVALTFAVTYRHAGALACASASTVSASYFGTSYGLMLLAGLASLYSAVANGWMKAEPVAVLALVGNAVGLVLFSPPLTIAVFAVVFLLQAVFLFVAGRRVFAGSGSFRCALSILIAVAAPVLYILSSPDVPGMADKIAAFARLDPFAKDFFAVREVLSSLALKTWKANPWIGTGIGSFPLDLRFAASEADWEIVSPTQLTALNGWWHLIVERGVVGAGMFVVATGLLVWTYFSRLIASFSSVHIEPEHLAGPLALAAVIALTFFNCSFLRPEVILLTGALLSFSGGAFPARPARDADGKVN